MGTSSQQINTLKKSLNMAPQYKLTYFNSKGILEPVRLLLAHANVEYEDHRLSREEWPKYKDSQPWKTLPVLHHGDFVLSQSLAILHYLSKRHGYDGESERESAKIEEYVLTLSDLKDGMVAIHREQDSDKRTEMMKTFQEKFTFYCSKFEKILQENGKFVVGKKFSAADFYLAYFVDLFVTNTGQPEILDSFPALKSHQGRVLTAPGVKEWIANRPVTPH